MLRELPENDTVPLSVFQISLIASGSFQSYYPVQAMSDTASSQIVVSTRIANLIADANGAKVRRRIFIGYSFRRVRVASGHAKK